MAGVTDLSTVKYAVLETTGRISVLPYAQERPATAKDLGLSSLEAGLPMAVISDGRILSQNLKLRGLNEEWLTEAVKSKGFTDASQIFLMTVDEQGRIYLSAKEEAS